MGDSEENKGQTRPSTEPYRGVRDFYPEDMATQNYLFSTMHSVARQFGFVEYSASVLEPAELYEAKSSEEIVNEQMYTFTDRGDRRVALRPEMTPTIARMIAKKRRELGFPLRWYSIPNVFRYERPQRGRLREHWQLNADLFGAAGIDAEVEIISLAHTLMLSFGAKEDDFEIRISDRKTLMQELEQALKLGAAAQRHFIRLLDRKEKMSEGEFVEAASALMDADQLDEFSRVAEKIEASVHDTGLLQRLEERGINNARIAPDLVRGFDYYTGTVFEVFDTSPENKRSLFGGGRYDNLLEIFGADPVPAVGFGMGDVTMRDFLETRGLLPPYMSSTTLFIGTTDIEKIPFANRLAMRLRQSGITVEINLTGKKIGDQIALADKHCIPHVLVIGDKEIETHTYTVKHLGSGAEEIYSEDGLISYFEQERPR